jgi:fatty acid desaturase
MEKMDKGSESTKKESVPGKLNITLAVFATSLALTMLWLASHTTSILIFVPAVIVFALVNNTNFSLLHEAVHGIFHENLAWNEAAGRILAGFFPTGFTLQRIAHLGHHRRNRTDAEIFDYYQPDDNLFVKYFQWYGILTGIYWLVLPLSCFAFLLTPGWLIKRLIAWSKTSDVAFQVSAEGMFSGYENANFMKIKAEILLSILIQVAIIYGLGLNVWGWAACYAAFAFTWSSLQYTDHAFSERDVYDGAWNLRVNRVIQTIFLNYHHHRVHHQHPTIPWTHLGRYIDENEFRPTFMKIYLKMWAGPRPVPKTKDAAPDILPVGAADR